MEKDLVTLDRREEDMNSDISAHEGAYRWWGLTMATSANFVVNGTSFMCMPVFFTEISQTTGLTLQHLLFIWSMVPLATFIMSIPAGMLGDRFGVRWVSGLGLLACAVFGALRGRASDFPSFMAFMFLFGASMPLVSVNLPKMLGALFPSRQLGLANGIVASSNGIGVALALGLSATVLSPALGGWQNVLYLWGSVTAVLGFLWLLTLKVSSEEPSESIQAARRKIGKTFGELLRKRQIILLCSINFLFLGAYLGWSGSMPFLLERVGGWPAASAHSLVSLPLWAFVLGCFVVPAISDRLGLRRPVIGIGFFLVGVSGFLSFLLAILLSTNWMSWAFLAISGFFCGVIPLNFAVAVETPGIGPGIAGTAVGMIMTSGNLGGYIFPTIIGWISGTNPGVGASIFIISLCFLVGFGGAGAVGWLLQETGPKGQSASE
jgi:NNP family nitrate/nitrite transporter-like MFS transporter